jgi:ATP-dependent protease HslVU (ClpYQ) peptidase subunit
VTTIAYRAGELAGDSLITAGETKLPDRCRKVFRFRDGRLFAGSGDGVAIDILKIATRRCLPIPRLKNVNALLIFPDGKIAFYEEGKWSDVYAEYVAMGNGAHYALGAMAVGASAREAVRAGCKLDTHSGGRIHHVNLEKRRPRVARAPVKLAPRPQIKLTKPEPPPRKYKRTAIGRHARPKNKDARRGFKPYRGQG